MKRLLAIPLVVAAVFASATATAQAYDKVGWFAVGDSSMSCGEAEMIAEYAWDVGFKFGESDRTDLLAKQCLSKPSPSSYWLKGGDLAAPGAGGWKCLLDYDSTGPYAHATQVGCNRI